MNLSSSSDSRWSAITDNYIICDVCPRHCRIGPGKRGVCHARENRVGKNIPANYGYVTSIALDPIEKKPLYRFHPGGKVLSFGSFGCNMRCPFCQNSSITTLESSHLADLITPEEAAELCARYRARGNIGAAFTYNEPMIGYEFVRDTAKLVREKGMYNAVVTNGNFERETLDEVLPYIDAFNIDLKCFTESGYRSLGGNLETVKNFIAAAAEKAHIEITTLIVPGLSDADKDMRRETEWIASISKSIPLHITRFFPRHKMTDERPTDIALMHRLADIASEELEFVYLGNI
ncbi:MAG: AmmeMemoRadiSam system radical SAM enzyme [Clostridiales bacterium]|nr:AmmeMemoRadiSam system radical SAM enzyme [Clostridiales bacterium]